MMPTMISTTVTAVSIIISGTSIITPSAIKDRNRCVNYRRSITVMSRRICLIGIRCRRSTSILPRWRRSPRSS